MCSVKRQEERLMEVEDAVDLLGIPNGFYTITNRSPGHGFVIRLGEIDKLWVYYPDHCWAQIPNNKILQVNNGMFNFHEYNVLSNNTI
jgi:hypothetical protein